MKRDTPCIKTETANYRDNNRFTMTPAKLVRKDFTLKMEILSYEIIVTSLNCIT